MEKTKTNIPDSVSIAKEHLERSKEIEMLFQVAMNKVQKYIKENSLNCSTKIKFGGFIDDLYSPIYLAYQKSENTFIIMFSSHFFDNDNTKILNSLIRYIVTTNKNHSFKTLPEVKKELKKLPFDTHYDVSFRNNYLESDSPVVNGVICESCLRVYKCSTEDDLFKNVQNYKCQCTPEGGKLSLIINGKKQLDDKRQSYYKNLTLGDVTKLTKERELKKFVDTKKMEEKDFDKAFFSEEGLEVVNNIISQNPKGINRKHVGAEVEKHLKDEVILNMLSHAFPHQYYNAFRYGGFEVQKHILEHPNTHPCYKSWNLKLEKERIFEKEKYMQRKSVKYENAADMIKGMDLPESTKKNLLAVVETNGKKISRMRTAEYLEIAVSNNDVDFIKVMNNHLPEVYLDAFKHLHKAQKDYLLKNYPPISENFTEEVKKKLTPKDNGRKTDIVINTVNTDGLPPLDKLANFMKNHKKIFNKDIAHEIIDAAYKKDEEYIRVLFSAFDDKIKHIRQSFNNDTLKFLDGLGL